MTERNPHDIRKGDRIPVEYIVHIVMDDHWQDQWGTLHELRDPCLSHVEIQRSVVKAEVGLIVHADGNNNDLRILALTPKHVFFRNVRTGEEFLMRRDHLHMVDIQNRKVEF